MSFAKLLSKDAGIGNPEGDREDESEVEHNPASTRAAGKHDAAKRMIQAMHASDHEGFSGAMEDWHELHGASGAAADAKPEESTPFGSFGGEPGDKH